MAKRAYGEGAVYQRHDHESCPPPGADKQRPEHKCLGRWVGTIEAGYTRSGARRRVTVYGKTEKDAARKLRDKRNELERGESTSSASARTTVKAWSEEWLKITQHKLRPKPWATDASAVRRWIVPTIGHKRLADLTPADRRAVAEAQRKAGRSTSTAKRTDLTLTSMLKAAMVEGYRVPDRVLMADSPRLAVNDRDAMPIAAALAVLFQASLLIHGSRWAMALLGGLRQAECLGLTWDAVDLERGLLNVEWQLQPLPYLDKKDRSKGFRVPDGYEARHLVDAYHLVRPKTRKGFRVIPLVPFMVEALRDWREVAPENPWGLVWPTTTGRPASAADDREEWYALQCTAEVGHPAGRCFYVHEARHTTAQRLKELGVDDHEITTIMGHSSILTSRGYMHASQAQALDAMTRIAGALEMGA